MPTRILREGIVTSPRVIRLSWPAEVFYRRLMSVVDDFGRYHGHPTLLRAACYPLQLEKVSDSDIGKWLAETREAALVRVYEVSSSQYLELLDFRQQVRAKKSKFPDPPPVDAQVISICEATAKQPLNLDVDEVEDEGKARRKRRNPPKTRISPGFTISDRVRVWAEKNNVLNIEAHFEYFVSKCKAKGYEYVDWDEGFMEAVRKDWAGIGKGEGKRFVV